MKIEVLGIGHTKFGVLAQSIEDLIKEVATQALTNAHISLKEIDAIYISNFSSSFAEQGHLPAVVAEQLNIETEITRVESACASGSLAVKQAAIALLSGMYKNVL